MKKTKRTELGKRSAVTARTTTFGSTPIVRGFLAQKYENITREQDLFTDPLFPPTEQSIYSTKEDLQNYDEVEVPKFLKENVHQKFLSQFALSKKDKEYTWKRLSELYKIRDWNICNDSKEKNLCKDVLQGELGDCYFLSALAAWAENSDRIKSLFPTTKISDKGVYETQVYLHGEPTKIVVDDYVPVIEKEGFQTQIAFAGINPETNNIWPWLLEKAWAKCNLSYEDIAAGNSAEAFEFWCPAPFDTYYHNAKTEKLFSTIQEAHQNGYIVVSDISETANTNWNVFSKMGWITNHAYSVVDSIIWKDKSDKDIRLLKIRNPWGTNEWWGDWSDNSKKWTTEYKAAVNLEQKEDGIFWMAYEDFIQFYTSTHICQIHDDYEFISKKFPVETEEPFNIVSVNVPKKGSGYFEVNLKNQRIYRNLKGLDEFVNPYCNISVFRKDGNNIQFIGGDSGRQDRWYVHVENLERGLYYVSVTFPKKREDCDIMQTIQARSFERMTYRVGLYTPISGITISTITEKDKSNLSNFFEDLIAEMAENTENKYYFGQEGEKDSFRAIRFDDTREGFGFIYYNNESEAYIHERASIIQWDNVNIIPILKKGEFVRLETTIDEEVEYEDQTTRDAMDSLKKNVTLESSVDVIRGVKRTTDISEKSPLELQFNIAPHSTCIIILQRSDEDAAIDLNSDICFNYLPNVFLSEEKFKPKKCRLKYNDKPTEIYECVTEHNSGVFFQYKNKSRNLKLQVKVGFKDLNNLFLNLISDDREDGNLNLRESKSGKFRDDSKENSVSWELNPGQSKFFSVKAVDIFKKFSYTCEIDYQFCIARSIKDENETRKD